MPFRQQDAAAERQVIRLLGRQVQIEAQARGGGLAILGHAQVVQILCRTFVGRFVFLGGTVDLDIFGPAENALGAEKHHEAIFSVRHVDPLCLITAVFFAFLAFATFVAFGFFAAAAAGGCAGRRGGVQPQVNRLRRALGTRHAFHAAGVLQGCADGCLLFAFALRQAFRLRALGQHGIDQAVIARCQAGKARQNIQRGLLVAPYPGLGRVGFGGGQGNQPEI